MERWCNEKREVVIEGCYPEALSTVLDLIWYKTTTFISASLCLPQDNPKFGKVLDISEMFLMKDLRENWRSLQSR